MLQKSLAYIALLLLFQLLVEINCQITPGLRNHHSATHIDNKLYILAGSSGDGLKKDFFYLDVSVAFDTKKLSWQDLSGVNTVPPHDNAATVKGGANNNTLFLYGGFTIDGFMRMFYTFDPQSNSWSVPYINGDPMRKFGLTGIINNNGIMYLWSGEGIGVGFQNDFITLNTANLNFGRGSLVNAPTPRKGYGAVLLPNNNIIYMGGWDNNELTLNLVHIYDTINDSWSQKTTSGKIPSNRDSFSTVLGLDGQRVIIFGGATANTLTTLPPVESIYVLNLNNFEWSIPKVSGPTPNSRMFHRANVIGVYMVISFGLGYDQPVESDILLLDIRNNDEYIWTYNFDPSITIPSGAPSAPSPPSATSTSKTKTSASASATSASQQTNKSSNNIGAIIGSLFSGIIISFGSFFLYKWSKNKRRRSSIIPTLENNNNNKGGKLTSTERSINNHEEKELPIPINNNNNEQEIIIQTPKTKNTTDNEIITGPVINEKYNHGQEVLITDPVINNSDGHEASENSSAQINDNVLENFKSDMLQVVRQEIMQNLKLQNNKQS